MVFSVVPRFNLVIASLGLLFRHRIAGLSPNITPSSYSRLGFTKPCLLETFQHHHQYRPTFWCLKKDDGIADLASEYDPVIRAKNVNIPLDRIDFNYARSSGPGGQNVNKLNTKAEIRFHIESATWLASEVRERLLKYQANKVTKDGELFITSQEHRTQAKNRDDCIFKLKVMVAEAMMTPKERTMWVGLSEKGKQKRRDEKFRRKDVKESRRKVSFDD